MDTSKAKIILAIDTSCDETSVAITKDNIVVANVLSTQIELHRKYGGVVPSIARRAHEENIDSVIQEAMHRAKRNLGGKFDWSDVDAVAVTFGPGLAIALEVGISKAKVLSKQHEVPLIAINHMEGHLLSSLGANLKGVAPIQLSNKRFPLLGLLISGKHTELIVMKDFGRYSKVGQTLDDGVGEAYDKVARMLGIGYPGGPVVTEFAKLGNPEKYPLPIPMHKDERMNYSYSGLKTAVYYLVRSIKEEQGELSKQQIYDISASFEFSAIEHLKDKLDLAIKKYNPKLILVGGGVGASAAVRKGIRSVAKLNELRAYFPFSKNMYMDNAAMIGVAAYFKILRGADIPVEFDREPRASIEDVK